MRSTIICVDDEKTILGILYDQIKNWFGSRYDIEKAQGGEEALEVLDSCLAENRDVSCIIVDYIMPGMKGDELLEKVNERDSRIKKIMLTSYSGVDGIVNAINRAGLYRYVSKPWDPKDLMLTLIEAIKSFEQTKESTRISKNFEALHKKYEIANKDLHDKYKSTIEAFTKVLELQDKSYKGRPKRVSLYATLLAKKLHFNDDDLNCVTISAMLHGVGRTVLNPTELNDTSNKILKQQIEASEKIISEMADSEKLLPAIKYQFEQFSGDGVLGLSGDEIPTEAGIISVCDYFDELRNRSDTEFDQEAILLKLKESKNTLFSPLLVDNFIQVIIDNNL